MTRSATNPIAAFEDFMSEPSRSFEHSYADLVGMDSGFLTGPRGLPSPRRRRLQNLEQVARGALNVEDDAVVRKVSNLPLAMAQHERSVLGPGVRHCEQVIEPLVAIPMAWPLDLIDECHDELMTQAFRFHHPDELDHES